MYHTYLYSRVGVTVFILTYDFSIKPFVRTDTLHKNLIIVLIKNMPSGRFWVLQIPFIKKNVEHLQKRECKRNAINRWIFWENLRSRSFIVNFNIIVETTDIKLGLLSKHLFERTQQHGNCTKPLGSDLFV